MKSTLRCRVVISLFAGACIGLALAGSAQAQGPTISSIFPLSVRPGQTQDVIVRGGNLAGATQLWTSFPSRSVLTPQKPNNGKNPGEVSFRITVPADTLPGPYGLRVAASQGISPLRILLVDDLAAAAISPGNTTPAAAQRISLPATVDATLEPLLNHFYKFHVEAGQRLAMEIYARRIGSALDPTLRLFDAAGREIAYSDDLPGLSEDAQIEHRFAKGGDYVLAVEDNLNQGGANYPYHLRIGDFPGALVALPLGARRGSEVTFRFADKSGLEIEPLHVKVPADPLLTALNLPARLVGGSTRSFATVLLSDRHESTETEPNDDRKTASRVQFGDNLNGRLQKPGDVDNFVFRAKAGQTARFTAFARRLGSPTDVVLRLVRADGNQLAYAEGTGANEATLFSSFPADGDYALEVTDLNRRGGPRYAYHVEFAPADPGFSLAAESDSLNIPAGGTAIITVKATRFGYNGPIALTAADLPAGVTSVPTVIGPGQDAVPLSLRAASAIAPGRVHPIRVVGSAHIGGGEVQASATVAEAIKAELGGMPYPPESLAAATALGIGPAAPFNLRTEPVALVFGRHLSVTARVIAERHKGFDGEIALAVAAIEKDPKPNKAPKSPLPPGVTAALKPIPKGASSVEITFSADSKPPLADFTAVLTGTLKGKENEPQPAPLALKLEPPFRLEVTPLSAKLLRKGTAKFKVIVRRNPAFHGEIVLACSPLPKGVNQAPARLKVGITEQEIVLAAAPDAPAGKIKNAKVRGRAKIGNERFTAEVPFPPLAVE